MKNAFNTVGMNKVIVINIYEDRKGSEIDDINLKTTFDYLEYDIEFWNDITLGEFCSNIKVFFKNFKYQYKSIIFFILAHGKDDRFFLKNDNIGMSLKNFIEEMKYPQLSDIPKIIFTDHVEFKVSFYFFLFKFIFNLFLFCESSK